MKRRQGFHPARRLIDLANLFNSQDTITAGAVTATLAEHGETAAELSRLSDTDIAAMRQACTRLGAVLAESDADQAAEGINAVLAEHRSQPRLSNHDGHVWHLHTEDPDAGWGDWLAASGALALAQLMSERGRIAWGRCSAPGCGRYYIDTGPGSKKRYCSTACSTRARVGEHRARRRAR